MKPPFKWAGGKSRLLPELRDAVSDLVGPDWRGTLYEPFCGAAALYFDLLPENAALSDANWQLVNALRCIRDDLDSVLVNLFSMKYDKSHYYQIRGADRESGFAKAPDVWKAARFLYLTKCSFNGLYRVNSKGQHNAPMGDYKSVSVDVDALEACAKALANVRINWCQYQTVNLFASAEDLVYFDPPYKPTSNTASFTDYTDKGFSASDHKSLAQLCRDLTDKGVYVIASNSFHPQVKELYSGFELRKVKVLRSISAKAKGRKCVYEYLITNKPLLTNKPPLASSPHKNLDLCSTL